jgi:hypothetical protein
VSVPIPAGGLKQMLRKISITELAATRQAILDDTKTPDLDNFEMLLSVEDQIERATFETDAQKVAGLLILFELNDAPEFADSFKAKLFSRIHEFV